MIAEGTSNQLKNELGGAVLEVTLTDADQVYRAASLLADLGSGQPSIEAGRGLVTVASEADVKALLEAARRLDDHGIALDGGPGRHPPGGLEIYSPPLPLPAPNKATKG